MAFSLITTAYGNATTQSNGSGPVDTTGADLIVVVASLAGATLSDSKSNSWTSLTAQTNSDKSARIWYCVSPTVGTGHYFATTGYSGITVLAFSGVNTSSAYDDEDGANQSGGSPIAAGTIAPSQEMELIIAGLAIGGSSGTTSSTASFTQGAYVEPGANVYGTAAFYKIKGSGDTSSESPSLSWSNGATGAAAVMAAFKAAGASGGPAAPADPTDPTTTSVTSTTATVGASTTETSGTRYVVVTTSATPPALNGNGTGFVSGSYAYSASSSISGSGAFTYSASGLTQGTTYYHHHVVGAGGKDSGVLTSAAFYPGTWRTGSEVSASGWSYTGSASFAGAVNEDSPSDAEYATSGTLSGTPVSRVDALDRDLPAGTYTAKLRIRLTTGTGYAKITYLNDSNVSQGASADVAITDTMTTYDISVTTTGTATRRKIELWV